MFKLLKSYQAANLLLIIFLTIAFLMKFFFDADSGIAAKTYAFSFYNGVYDFFSSINSPFLNKVIITLLILFEALFLTVINNHYNLLGKRSYLPMLIYIIIVINIFDRLEIDALIFANILFLTAWLNVKKAAGKEAALSNYFNASLLIGIASLFYFNYIFLVLILWINLLIIQRVSIREVIFSLLGVLTVWYFVWAYYFFNDLSSTELLNQIHFEINLKDFIHLTLSQKITRAYITLLFLLSIMYLLKYFINLKIDIRNNLKLLFALFLLGSSMVVFTNSSLEMVHLLAIPVSLFISNYFLSIRKILLGNILLGGLILLTIFNLYFGFLIN